ncbi:hypothetical protein RDI58_020108 [Solanum bulbocastanum]|uniref:Uncharacterized protein n=1 Tax=Solanum bulbocastanum TaxID=147425 RepID=A0AAN8TBX3_SOLBU
MYERDGGGIQFIIIHGCK